MTAKEIFKFPCNPICPYCLGAHLAKCIDDGEECNEGVVSCSKCDGSGDFYERGCTACDSLGEITCENCKGEGVVECSCINGGAEEFLYDEHGGEIVLVDMADLTDYLKSKGELIAEVNEDALLYYDQMIKTIENQS